GKLGTTIFASHNRNKAYDPGETGLSAIPQFERFTLNPKLFVYFNDKTKFNLGINATVEDRLGGNMLYIQNRSIHQNQYFEENKTRRYSSQLSFDHAVNESSFIRIKNSISHFK